MVIDDRDIDPVKPLPIPTVTVYGSDGRRLVTGYYDFHQNVSRCFSEDVKPDDFDHVVVSDGFADWNLQKGFELKKIVPDGGKVEIDYPKCRNTSHDGFACSECGKAWFVGFNLGPLEFDFCPSCGREVTRDGDR